HRRGDEQEPDSEDGQLPAPGLPAAPRRPRRLGRLRPGGNPHADRAAHRRDRCLQGLRPARARLDEGRASRRSPAQGSLSPGEQAKEAFMPIKLEDELFDLEKHFWTEGADYYRSHLAPSALMVFPEPAGVLVKDEIASSIGAGARWADVELEEHRVLELSDKAAVVTYKA